MIIIEFPVFAIQAVPVVYYRIQLAIVVIAYCKKALMLFLHTELLYFLLISLLSFSCTSSDTESELI